MDAEKIIKIIESAGKSGLTDVEITAGDVKIKLARAGVPVALQPAPAIPVCNPADMPKPLQHVQMPAVEDKAPDHDPSLKVITSPIVGTFYASPKPDSPAFVSVGSTVKKGDGLCIIEAMKLMNEIDAEYACEIVEILVKNEQMVEFGQELFRVREI